MYRLPHGAYVLPSTRSDSERQFRDDSGGEGEIRRPVVRHMHSSDVLQRTVRFSKEDRAHWLVSHLVSQCTDTRKGE